MKINPNLVLLHILILVTMITACTPGDQTQAPATREPSVAPTVKQSTPPPTWTATPTATATALPSPTVPPSATKTPTPTPTRPPTRTPSPSLTATLTPTPTLTSEITATPTLSPTAQVEESPRQVLTGTFDVEQALILLYENPTTRDKAEVLLVETFQQAGVNRYLVLTEIPGADCPSCIAAVGGALFSQDENRWLMDVDQPNVISLGSNGHAPSPVFIQIGPDAYGVRFDQNYASTGGFGERAILVTEITGTLKTVLSVETAMGMLTDEEETLWAYESETRFTPGEHPDYYDFEVTTRGTKIIDKAIAKFVEVKRYVFVETEYRLAERSQRVLP